MSKAVLISIQPKWCELIASGKKTVEVRKTKPRLETPFKVYIYETQGKLKWCNKCQDTDCERPYPNCACHEGWGKVIGEFVCKKVENIEIRHFTVFGHENRYTAVGENPDYQWLKKSCLSYDEVAHYAVRVNGQCQLKVQLKAYSVVILCAKILTKYGSTIVQIANKEQIQNADYISKKGRRMIMKKLFRKIQMWWWKKHNPEKYCIEYWRDVGINLAESAKRATASLTTLASTLKE